MSARGLTTWWWSAILIGCAPTAFVPLDADGDGVVAGEDCNDGNAAVYPGAPEHCDGVDEDCDGEIDEDATDPREWHLDADADGYGDASDAVVACRPPAGRVRDGTDCDDTDPSVYPAAPEPDCTDPVDRNCDGSVGWADADGDGFAACRDCDDGDDAVWPGAEERCNAVDDDCNGRVDDDAEDVASWYVDADGDGFGDPEGPVRQACTAPPGHVPEANDCDDADATRFPGAPEACTDPIDRDCDGSVTYADADLDGVAACEDCDDSRADVRPGALELCNGRDDDCNGETDESSALDARTWFADSDLDGFGDPAVAVLACDDPGLEWVADARDCDDLDATVSPAEPERCGGGDENCDGQIDGPSAVDAGVWYADADRDGFGDAGDFALACTRPGARVANPDDCDDAAGHVNPAAAEVCGGDVDEDCDTLIDDDDPSVDRTTFVTFYLDGDGDGWGVQATEACERPPGAADRDGDCDDTNPEVRPDALERCNGIDDDCEGTVDVDAVLDTLVGYSDADGDGFGDAASTVEACTLPDGYVADATDCDDSDPARRPGAPELCWDDLDQDCDGRNADDDECFLDGELAYSEADLAWFGVVGALVGSDLAVGDVTDDGRADVWIGRPSASGGLDELLLRSGPDGSGSTLLTSLRGRDPADAFGDDLAFLGHFDGDGLGDVAAAASSEDDIEFDMGHVYVFSGSGATSVDDAVYDFVGEEAGDLLGRAVAGGVDLDGDGLSELLIGAPRADRAVADRGVVYLVRGGGPAGTVRLGPDTAHTIFYGEKGGDQAGFSVAFAGDLDGDGLGDVVIGARYDDEAATSAGKAYVVYGPIPGGDYDLARAPTMIRGDRSGHGVGELVVGVGDLDADGYDDLGLVTGTELHVFLGPIPRTRVDVGDADFLFTTGSGDGGVSSLSAGDLDGDGYDDLVVGVLGHDHDGLFGTGAAYVLYGPPTGGGLLHDLASVEIVGEEQSGLGRVVAVGDVNGDGYDDAVVGALTEEVGGDVIGSVRTFYGGNRVEHPVVAAIPDLADDADGDGFSENAGDCDDTDAAVAPDVTEVCGNRLDDDCDGYDPPCVSLPVAGDDTDFDLTFTTDVEYAYVGTEMKAIGDVNCDGYVDVAIGAPGRPRSNGTGGQLGVFFGPLSQGESDFVLADVVLLGSTIDDDVGGAVTELGDFDDDGCDDFAIVAGGSDEVYIVLGDPELPIEVDLVDEADYLLKLPDDGTSDELLRAARGQGDLNGDGIPDFAVGAPGGTAWLSQDNLAFENGAVYVLFGGGRTPGVWDLAVDADVVLYGENDFDVAGYRVSLIPDLDGDGSDELLIGAEGPYWKGERGIAYLFDGPLAAGDYPLWEAPTRFLGAVEGASIGDFDGDGYSDLAVGNLDLGVFFGPVAKVEHAITDADLFLADTSARTVVGAIDLDQDGYDDFIATPDLWQGDMDVYLGSATPDLVADAGWDNNLMDATDIDGDGYVDVLSGSQRFRDPATLVQVAGVGRIWRGGVSYTGVVHVPPVRDRATDDDGDGYSEQAGDCDDVDPAVSPGATEVCGDGLDNDCSGGDERCLRTGAFDVSDLDVGSLLASSGVLGASVLGDVDGDGIDDVAVATSRWLGLIFGPVPERGRESVDAVVNNVSNVPQLSGSLAGGDVTGDGNADVVVGTQGEGVRVVGGDFKYGFGAGFFDDDGIVSLTDDSSGSPGDWVGVLDFNGDGKLDVAASDPLSDVGASDAGAVLIWHGPFTEGESRTTGGADQDLYDTTVSGGLFGGTRVAVAGDTDKDGFDDLLIADPSFTGAVGADQGRVFLCLGDTAATSDITSCATVLEGSAVGEAIGASLGYGDFDGDGYSDVVIGAPAGDHNAADAGQVYVAYGPVASGTIDVSTLSVRFVGTNAGDELGLTVGSVGDVDGDGTDDLGVGGQGGFWVFLDVDTLSGDVDASTADIVYTGDASYVSEVVTGGDLDGDGYADIWACDFSGGHGTNVDHTLLMGGNPD